MPALRTKGGGAMSMLSRQCDELREMAEKFEGYQCGEISRMLREAADTIDSLRKQVAKCQIAELKADYDTSRHFELFGTPERAARTLMTFSPLSCAHCALYGTCGDDQDKDCLLCDYDALIEWLRGEGE